MDIKEVKRLVGLVEAANISHLSIESDGSKIEIKKELAGVAAPVQTSVVIPQAAPAAAEAGAPASEAASAGEAVDPNLVEVKAEMVGTFYTSSSPDADAFVKVGDRIEPGTVICIIEAMKLFNEIEAEAAGTIEKICVNNGDAVEFGQTLFLIRP